MRFSVLVLAVSIASTSATSARAAAVCCTAAEIQILGDINFDTRAAFGHTGPVKERLYTLAMHLKAGTWGQWADPDKGYILGLMAATHHYQNDAGNRAIVDAFAAMIGVIIKQVSLPAPVVVPPAPTTPPPVVQPAPAPIPAGGIEAEIRRIVQDELSRARTVRADTVIIGKGCPADASAPLQVCAPGAASILLTSNVAGGWYQSPKRGVGELSLGGDRGLRLMLNGYGTTQCYDAVDPTNGVHYQKCFREHVDPTQAYGLVGFDSRAHLSLLRSDPCQVAGTEGCTARDYTQDVVLFIDPHAKKIGIESWQTGWRWEFVRSSCRTCRDIVTPVQ